MFYPMMLMYFKWKQDEILKSIRFNVIWRNKVKLYGNFQDYHQFTVTVYEVSKLINIVIGIVYVMTPILFAQAIMVFNQEVNSFFDRLLQIGISIIFPIWIFLIYMMHHLATIITTVNQSIPKYLYPTFNNKDFARLTNQVGLNLNYSFGQLSNVMVQMKIDSFIARLNEEYVGFYCFNLFKLTKLAFFQYLYVFMTAYVLVHDFKK